MKNPQKRPPHDDAEAAYIKALCVALHLPLEDMERYFANRKIPVLPKPDSQKGTLLAQLVKSYGKFVSLKQLQDAIEVGEVGTIVSHLRKDSWPINQS